MLSLTIQDLRHHVAANNVVAVTVVETEEGFHTNVMDKNGIVYYLAYGDDHPSAGKIRRTVKLGRSTDMLMRAGVKCYSVKRL